MDRWMDEWMMYKWRNGQVDRIKERQMDEYIDEWTISNMVGKMDVNINGWLDRCTNS